MSDEPKLITLPAIQQFKKYHEGDMVLTITLTNKDGVAAMKVFPLVNEDYCISRFIEIGEYCIRLLFQSIFNFQYSTDKVKSKPVSNAKFEKIIKQREVFCETRLWKCKFKYDVFTLKLWKLIAKVLRLNK